VVAVVPPIRCATSDAVSRIERNKVDLATVAFILVPVVVPCRV